VRGGAVAFFCLLAGVLAGFRLLAAWVLVPWLEFLGFVFGLDVLGFWLLVDDCLLMAEEAFVMEPRSGSKRSAPAAEGHPGALVELAGRRVLAGGPDPTRW
jgi:hypothetical protein